MHELCSLAARSLSRKRMKTIHAKKSESGTTVAAARGLQQGNAETRGQGP